MRINYNSYLNPSIDIEFAEPLCFATREEAESCLLSIHYNTQENIINYNPKCEKPYYISLYYSAINLHRQSLISEAPRVTLPTLFIIKSLRTDSKGFFRNFIRTITIGEKKPLRTTPKKNYTVTGKGIFKRESKREENYNDLEIQHKKSQYTKTQKAGFSKAQSASIGTTDYHPKVFGVFVHKRTPFRNAFIPTLPAVIVDNTDLLFTDRNCVSDFGTVRRPYDFNTLDEAKVFYETYVSPISNHRIMFSSDELIQFIAAVKNSNNKHDYNEILVRMRWSKSANFRFAITANTLECRLQTQEYIRLFKQFLKSQNLVNDDYTIPCIYYLPDKENTELHCRVYTAQQQALDRIEAKLIYLNEMRLKDHHENGSYQFLLGLTPDEIKAILKKQTDGMPNFWRILFQGVQLMESLAELAGFSLEAAINDPLYKPPYYQDSALFHLANAGYEEAVANFIMACPPAFTLERILPVDGSHDSSVSISCLAAHKSQVKIIKALHDKKVLIPYDSTSIFYAAKQGNCKIVEMLSEEKGAQFTPTNSPLIAAAKHNHMDVVKLLITRHVDMTHINLALLTAARWGHVETVRYLAENGANVNFRNQDSISVLGAAIQEGHYLTVVTLLELKASPHLRNNHKSPLFLATSLGYLNITKALVEYGAYIGTCLYRSHTSPFPIKDTKLFTYLIDQGAYVNEYDLNCPTDDENVTNRKIVENTLNNDPILQEMTTQLDHLLDTKCNDDLGRHLCIIGMKAHVKNTKRYDNEAIVFVQEFIEEFIRLDKTALSLLNAIKQQSSISSTAKTQIKQHIQSAYQNTRLNLHNINNIQSTLMKQTKSFHTLLKLTIVDSNPSALHQFSITRLWAKKKVFLTYNEGVKSTLAPY